LLPASFTATNNKIKFPAMAHYYEPNTSMSAAAGRGLKSAAAPVAAAAAGRTALVWLRNDLRLHDHAAFAAAAAKGYLHVVPLFCFNPAQFETRTPFGFPKTGPFRSRFLLQALADLKKRLQATGCDLVVRHGYPAHEIATICAKGHVDVFFHKETCSEETDDEAAVAAAVAAASSCSLTSFWGSTIVHIDDLPFAPRDMPDVFTSFRKAVEAGGLRVRAASAAVSRLAPLPDGMAAGELSLPPAAAAQAAAGVDPRAALDMVGGETQALERVAHYLFCSRAVERYKETRNGLIGADYSSKFSPWLSLGCLSPRFVYWEIQRFEKQHVANDSTYWLVFELLWRDFFRFWSIRVGKSLFYLRGPKNVSVSWLHDQAVFERWRTGRTGHPFVDANMRELLLSGWMSNRGRQNVASFLTKDLGLDWRMGAEWFESQLVDYDVCSNWGNWSYASGVGCDPRDNRRFNIQKQSGDYDPNGDFCRLWCDELRSASGKAAHQVQPGALASRWNSSGPFPASSGDRSSSQKGGGAAQPAGKGKEFWQKKAWVRRPE
jgi:deoxyribodipyrimidine photo-lyase